MTRMARSAIGRQAAWSSGDVGGEASAQPVSRYATAPTSERIRSARLARTCPRASAIITASASPTRVFILARPRM